ncbi:hypothetical protein MHY20_10030 [Helcobacillus sp. ACRRO]|uniref:hypothetical protein n=1 Tax=Helcobacillus sp. ACRRO TaxID=2918202 RepID=UPI001EF4ADCC|nr:hypothetical protein [Helcobacillus sp. ACRRO]MCG7427939.1 hypothetical protein [Helcobacillus sp. ACRRO]
MDDLGGDVEGGGERWDVPAGVVFGSGVCLRGDEEISGPSPCSGLVGVVLWAVVAVPGVAEFVGE